MLRFGPEGGPVVMLALPLFEEANRCRAFGVSILRALSALGVGGVLPDVPGHGDSLTALATTTLLRQREAIEKIVDDLGAAGRASYAVGIRSGALLDTLALVSGRWHLAPQEGGDLVRELLRLAKAGGAVRRDADLNALMGAGEPTAIGGNLISGEMIADLQCAEVYHQPGVPRRTVRLETDAAAADRHVPGPPLWRRAEPDNDLALARTLATDIADWIADCDA